MEVEAAGSSMESGKVEVSIDEAIEQHVGSQLGVSQMMHMLLLFIAWVFDAQTTLVTIFSDAQPQLVSTSSVAGDQVKLKSVCGLEPGTWEWIEGNKSSVIAEFGLICNRKFLAAVPSSFFFLGSILGCAAFGALADGWVGRKRCLFLSCVGTSLSAFLTSLSPNIWIYAFLRFSTGFLKSGLSGCFVLASESVPQKWRPQVGQCGFLLFTAGFFSLPLIAYPTRNNWRNLYTIISISPLIYSLFLLLFVSESPRWLLVRGRSDEALDVLRRFAARSGNKLPENLSLFITNSSSPAAAAARDESLWRTKWAVKNSSSSAAAAAAARDESLWRTKWAVKRMILVMLSGFGVGFVYYGIQLNVGNLSFNLYFSVALNALMEIPAVFIASVVIALMNRRLVFSLLSCLAGVLCLLCILFSSDHVVVSSGNVKNNWVQLLTEGAGFMAICIAFDMMYTYCVELFPTNVRNLAVAMFRQANMLGASLAPLLVAVGRMSSALSFLVFGVVSILSATLVFWLPETRNSPLYDTLKQQHQEEENIQPPA